MKRLKELRLERGLSQTKLAQYADINPATINRIERGRYTPSLNTLMKVAAVLDVEVADLLKGYPQ